MFVHADLIPLHHLQFSEEDLKVLELAKQIDLDERSNVKTLAQESKESDEAFLLNQSLLRQVEARMIEDRKYGVVDKNAVNNRNNILQTIEDLKKDRIALEQRKKGKQYVLEKIHEHLKEIKHLQMELEKFEE